MNGRVDVWKDKEFKDDMERVKLILDRARIGWDGFQAFNGERSENKVIQAINDGQAELVECKQTY